MHIYISPACLVFVNSGLASPCIVSQLYIYFRYFNHRQQNDCISSIVTVKILQTISLIFLQLLVYKTVSLVTIGKPEAATAVVVAPDDVYEDARNMLSCI